MAVPTKEDPHGLRPDNASFAEMMERMIDARIDERWLGRTSNKFDGTPDAMLVLELVGRGWAVFKPTTRDAS